MLTWRASAIVTAAPDIIYVEDRDGDGRAEHRQVLITGLNEGNQQLRPNGLRWGLDNWVYVASGSPSANYASNAMLTSLRAGTSLHIGAHDFRFRPDTGALEIGKEKVPGTNGTRIGVKALGAVSTKFAVAACCSSISAQHFAGQAIC